MGTGRPPLLTDELQAEAVKLARAGIARQVIADAVGIHPDTMGRWWKYGNPEWTPKEGEHCPEDREPYYEFRRAILAAQARPVTIAEATWMQAVQGRPATPEVKDANGKVLQAAQPAILPNWKAARDWLRLHRPDLYREGVDATVELGTATAQAVEAWAKSIEQLLAGGPGAGGE